MAGVFATSKRPPWPYDVEIDGRGFMVKPERDGEFVGKKTQPLTAEPTEYEYGSNSPFSERTYAMNGLVFGYGERIQPTGRPRRVRRCRGIDMSINGNRIFGPLFHEEIVNAGAPIVGFQRALHAGGDTIFALASNKVFRRVSDDSWTESLALPGGSLTRQAARFKDASGSPIDALYLATTLSNVYRYDGTTWSVAGVGQGPTSERATTVEVVGDDIIFGYGNTTQSTQGDPFVRASYAGAIRYGDGSAEITWLRGNKNTLFVMTDQGIFTTSAAGLGQELYPTLKVAKNLQNGVNAANWLDSMWVPWGDSLYQIDPNGALHSVGTERLLDNDTDVRGRIVATAGHNAWFNYELVYNEVTNTTYLLKFGSWVEIDDGRTRDFVQFFGVHNGAIAEWEAKRGVCMNVVYMPGSNDRLYIGFADGTIEWCWLPRNTPNPADDPLCEFVNYGEVYWPIHHAGFQADSKSYRGFSVFGSKLNRELYLQIEYRTDQTGTYEPIKRLDISTNTEVPVNFSLPGQRADFPVGTGVQGRYIDIREVYYRDDATATVNDTPVVDSVVIHEQVRPAFRLEYTMNIQAQNYVTKRNGTVERRSAQHLRSHIKTAAASVTPVEMVLPDEGAIEASIIDYTEIRKSNLKSFGVGWDITLKAEEFRPLTLLGTGGALGAFTYGTLEGYTYGELEQIL